MKNANPVELLLLGAWLAVEAAAVLLTALVALLLTVLSLIKKTPGARKPLLAPGNQHSNPAPPAEHPLALLADALQQLPHRELMSMAGTRRRLPKYQLAAMVAACS
jgi:hypothetical protein